MTNSQTKNPSIESAPHLYKEIVLPRTQWRDRAGVLSAVVSRQSTEAPKWPTRIIAKWFINCKSLVKASYHFQFTNCKETHQVAIICVIPLYSEDVSMSLDCLLSDEMPDLSRRKMRRHFGPYSLQRSVSSRNELRHTILCGRPRYVFKLATLGWSSLLSYHCNFKCHIGYAQTLDHNLNQWCRIKQDYDSYRLSDERPDEPQNNVSYLFSQKMSISHNSVCRIKQESLRKPLRCKHALVVYDAWSSWAYCKKPVARNVHHFKLNTVIGLSYPATSECCKEKLTSARAVLLIVVHWTRASASWSKIHSA